MKNTFKIFALLLILLNNSCRAQQMVQTPNDAYKLKTNEQQFINKPLKNLLQEIKPDIKSAGASNEEGYQYFSFSFIDYKELKTGKYIDKKKVNVYIYVKEQIDWQWEKRPKGKELVWTKEDAEKYGNLIVTRIKVIGKE